MNTRTLISILILLTTTTVMAQNQIIIPDTLSGTSFKLTLQNGTVQFFAGKETSTMGVNGNILGPTLIMQKGDEVDIKVENQLNEETTIHWHGMHVSASNDGGPHTVIEPEAIWNPSFTVMDRAATYWYHPHLHEKTNEQVTKGLAGFIIVRDTDEAEIELPRRYGIDDFPLVIQTKDFDANNQVIAHSNSDDVLLVNATIDPELDVPAQVVRLRLLNGSSQRVFNIGLSGNQTFYQIASDDGLLSKTNAVTRLRMAPGERAEILIDLDDMQGQNLSLMSYASEFQSGIYGATNPGMMSMMTLDGYKPNPMNGSNFEILKLNVIAPTDAPVTSIPTDLVKITPLSESSADQNRSLFFTPQSMGPNQLNGKFLINGTNFDMDVINHSIPLNNIEIWTITNQSGIAHPFHIHDVHFYVLDRNGAAPPPSEQGRNDVILIPPMESVRLIMQFTDFANDEVPYMYHCHMLTHEDDGMMGQFEVIDETTGFINKERISELKMYPNPSTSGNTIISVPASFDGEVKLLVQNMEGKIVKDVTYQKSIREIRLNLDGTDPGAYIVKLRSDNQFATAIFVVN